MKIRLLDVRDLGIHHIHNNGDVVVLRHEDDFRHPYPWRSVPGDSAILSENEYETKENISWERVEDEEVWKIYSGKVPNHATDNTPLATLNIEETVMISMDKKYKYANGEPARVLCNDRNHDFPVVSMTKDGILRTHLLNGMASGSRFDLVEVTPWDHLKIDDPVVVWNGHLPKRKRHFAGIRDGKPCTIADGKTSHTIADSTCINTWISWENCVHIDDYEGDV